MTTTNGNEERPLPDDWAWVQLGKLAKFINGDRGKNYPNRTQYVSSGIPFINAGHILPDGSLSVESMNYIARKRFDLLRSGKVQKGDLLYCLRGALGKVAVNNQFSEGAIASSLIIVRPDYEVHNLYLYYFLISPFGKMEIEKYDNGTAQPNLSAKSLKSYILPLAPFPEQKRIVAEIEKQFTRLDNAVAGLERLQSNLDRYKASLLKAACEGRLVPQHPDDEPAAQLLQRVLAERRRQWEAQEWQKQVERAKKKVEQARRKAAGLPYYFRDMEPEDWQDVPESEYAAYLPKSDKWKQKYDEPEPPETAVLPDLPDGWVWITVNQIGDVASGQTPKGANDSTLNGEIPWFKVGDMNTEGNEKFMRDAENSFSLEEAEQLGFHIHPAGTIIFPKRGGAIATNKKRILIRPSTYDLNTMGIKPSELIHDGYFWTWFSSVDLASLSTGSNVPQINHGDIEPLPLPLPPLAEQKRIVAEVERRLSVVAATQQTITANHTRANRLRQSILQQAFTGQLV